MKTTVQGLLTILMASHVLAGSGAEHAQQVQNRTVDAVRAQIPRETPGNSTHDGEAEKKAGEMNQPAPKMKGDDEFGEQMILARRAHVEPWTLGMDAQFFYTDNVALTPTNELDDTYLRTGFFAQYTNRIVNDWFMDASVSSFWFLHGKYDFFDFNLLRAEVGVTRRLPWLDDAFASVHYYRVNRGEAVRGCIFSAGYMASYSRGASISSWGAWMAR